MESPTRIHRLSREFLCTSSYSSDGCGCVDVDLSVDLAVHCCVHVRVGRLRSAMHMRNRSGLAVACLRAARGAVACSPSDRPRTDGRIHGRRLMMLGLSGLWPSCLLAVSTPTST
jgi:hypothetical protein